MTLNYLSQAFYFFKNHLLALACIQLPILLVIELLRMTLLPSTAVDATPADMQKGLLLSATLSLLLQPVYRAATIAYLQSVIDEQSMTVSRAYLFAMLNWGRMFLTILLSSLMVGLGLLLVILPGIYVAVRLSFADMFCVLERTSPFDAIGKSWERTDNYFWIILGGSAAIMLGVVFCQGILSALVGHTPILSTLVDLIFAFLGTLLTVFRFRIFCVMRGH